MRSHSNDRIYNIVSLVFVTLSVFWVIFVILQLASG